MYCSYRINDVLEESMYNLSRFNLEYRVQQCLNFLNNCVDKKRGCLPYFAVMFKKDPAEVRHDWPDFSDLTARYVEAFVFARRMLKIKEASAVELVLRKLLLSYFDEGDGLSYRPKPDKPYYSTILRREYAAHVAEGFDQARVLWALLSWFEDTQDELISTKINELIAALDRVLVKKDDYGYYDRSTFEPSAKICHDAPPMPHQFYFCGTQIHPLIECYRRLKNDKALELASRLTNYIVYHSDYFLEDGTWNCPGGAGFESAEMDGHTHSRFATVAGIATVGIVTANQYLVKKMKVCYDWFVENHCSSFGWSPEFLGRFGDADEGCETCAIMDQINCCFAFTEAGYPQYYEQVEKIARNQLLENQMLDTSLLRNTIEKPDTELSCFHNIADMVKGGFAGWAGVNDFIGNCDHHYCLMNCCGPAGTRALYDVYRNIYTIYDKKVYINIFMNREDSNIRIESQQPHIGQVEITLKKSLEINIVKRSWFGKNVEFTIDNEPWEYTENNNYYILASVPLNKEVVFKYGLCPKNEDVHVNGRDFKVKWLGDTVMDIAPKGKIMPMYIWREYVK